MKLQPFCGRSDRARGLFTVRFETDTLTDLHQEKKKRKDSVGTLINEDKQTHICTCSHTAHAQTDSSHFWVWLPSFVISESEGSNVFQHWIKKTNVSQNSSSSSKGHKHWPEKERKRHGLLTKTMNAAGSLYCNVSIKETMLHLD